MVIKYILTFLLLSLIFISIAYTIYKIISKKAEKERKINELLSMTEEGKAYLDEQNNKIKSLLKKLLPILYVFFSLIIIINIIGTIFIINEYLKKGINNISLNDLKLLSYPAMLIYLTIFLYRFIKTKNEDDIKK